MKVFLSWSGSRSRDAALLFREWLPQVIQAIDPWMSEVDIEKGAQWFAEISREVSASSFGIVFLTRENLEKPWLHFEAGALAKALSNDGGSVPRVAAYLLGVEPTDVVGPLKEFQHTKPTGEDTLKLLGSLNNGLAAKEEKALKDDVLKNIFVTFWPKLEEPLNRVIALKETEKPRRDVRDMVEEILEYVRPRVHAQERTAIAYSNALLEYEQVQRNHLRLQNQVLEEQRRLAALRAMRTEARVVGADDGQNQSSGAQVRAEVEKRVQAAEVDLARLTAELTQNEARLMVLREQIAAVRHRAITGE